MSWMLSFCMRCCRCFSTVLILIPSSKAICLLALPSAINCSNLTNDLGHPALNHVLKMIEAGGQPVAKISDAPGKSMCRDEVFLGYLMHVFEVSAKEVPVPTPEVGRPIGAKTVERP
jgi:Nicotinate phosphoribosyltransferase (NAPRTase) family